MADVFAQNLPQDNTPTADARNMMVNDLGGTPEWILGQTEAALEAARVPLGGAANQVLAKNSVTDRDLKWLTLTGGGDMVGALNLSDVASPATSLANIGGTPLYVPATTQTGTTHTLAGINHGSTVVYSNAGLVTVTLPTNASVALPVGFACLLFAAGAGGLTVSTTGLTLLGSSPNKKIIQNEGIYVEKTATDTWIILGGTAA